MLREFEFEAFGIAKEGETDGMSVSRTESLLGLAGGSAQPGGFGGGKVIDTEAFLDGCCDG